MTTSAATAIPVAARIAGFTYAIRNIMVEARKVEAAGIKVKPLNIGDPCKFDFQTPRHLIEAVEKAMRDGDNGYSPSAGIPAAREAVAADFTTRGLKMTPDRVLITSGASEGIEMSLGAVANPGDEVLVPMPTYPLYTAVLAKIGATAVYYRTDPARLWQLDVDDVRRRMGPRTKAMVIIDPNNPTGAIYSNEIRRALLELAAERGVVVLADEVYGDLAYDGPVPPMGTLVPDAPLISFSSLSKGYVAPGWRAGWLAVGMHQRMDGVLAAINKLADGRLCSPVPMQHAVVAALTGDRSHQIGLRAKMRERAELTARRLNAMPGMSCVEPRAAFYAMPQLQLPPDKTDQDYVLGLLRATGVLVVHGSGFGMPEAAGSFRVVFLAPPAELADIYDRMAEFTTRFLGA